MLRIPKIHRYINFPISINHLIVGLSKIELRKQDDFVFVDDFQFESELRVQ